MRKKINKLFIFLIILTLFITNIYAYSSLSNYKPKYGILNSNVNFRTTASTTSGKIRVLTKGTAVKMVANLDNFYIVEIGTNEVGVVSKAYVNSSSSAPKGAKTYTTTTISSLQTIDSTNLRGGPATTFRKVSTLGKGTTVKAIGYIDNWYVVVTSNNQVGCIRKDLLKSVTSSTSKTSTNTTNSFSMSVNEKTIFDLINKERTKAGLSKLSADSNLFKIARLKAKDMVSKSYFSHTSPTYGSPFNMMKTYGISYKVAGENIAGNPSLQAAVSSWMNSSTHKQNILSNSYNFIGIGVEKSDIYGYIIDVMFIRKIARNSHLMVVISCIINNF